MNFKAITWPREGNFVFFVPHCITLIVYSDSSATYVVDKEGEGEGGGGRAGLAQ